MNGSLPQIKDLGIPSNSRLFTCLYPPVHAVEPACKINPDKVAERLDKREKQVSTS
ncbi:hypothetical protein BACFIN_05658 [Bacteroides finegoldii DSM 17565]|nr:hypothetical protein BACFIN_05658 [Bacteroides finegoldii DSM 17565]